MSTKDFKQGMVAGAKPFGDKLEQLAGASERGVRDIQEGIGGVKDVVDAILDDLSVQEKKKIYDLDTPTGIAELEPEEKEYLLAVLFTIAEAQNEVTEYQRFYLRALKAYLGVVGIQSGIDLSTIENIESITTQKILLQTVMEFLYLAYQNHDYMRDYTDLFDYFSVNRRGIAELQQAIDHMAALLGLEGIACHYSPLAEPVAVDEEEETLEDEQETCAQRRGCNDETVIDGRGICTFKMRIEDVFSIVGRGIVVTGVIEEESISLDDEVTVFHAIITCRKKNICQPSHICITA